MTGGPQQAPRTPTHLVSCRTAFPFPASIFQQLWVKEFWAALVVRLKKGEGDADGGGCGLCILVWLCSRKVFPARLLQQGAAQWARQGGKLDPVGLRHGDADVAPALTAWSPSSYAKGCMSVSMGVSPSGHRQAYKKAEVMHEA